MYIGISKRITGNTCTVKPVFKDTVMRGHLVIRGHFLKMMSYLHHVKEPVRKGHLSCRDTFSQIYRCPLKTGLTVVTNVHFSHCGP